MWSNVYPRPMLSKWALKRKCHIAASSSFLGNLGTVDFHPPRKNLLCSHLVLRWPQHAHPFASQRIHHRRLLDRHYPPHQHRLIHFLEGPCPLPQLQPLTLLFQRAASSARRSSSTDSISCYTGQDLQVFYPKTSISCFRDPGL